MNCITDYDMRFIVTWDNFHEPGEQSDNKQSKWQLSWGDPSGLSAQITEKTEEFGELQIRG